MSSAIATVRAAFKADLESIITGVNYSNTVKYVYEDIGIESTEFPSLTLTFLPDTAVKPTDSNWSAYDLEIPFTIICEITSTTAIGTTSNLLSQQDSLVQDILRCISANYKDNIISTPAWNIKAEPNVRVTPVYPSGDNRGIFSISGTIHIRSLDNTFV